MGKFNYSDLGQYSHPARIPNEPKAPVNIQPLRGLAALLVMFI